MRRFLPLVVLLSMALVSCNRDRNTSGAERVVEPRELPTGAVKVQGPLLSYADVVDRVSPAVVTVRSSRRVRAPRQFPFSDDPFFQQFFGRIPRGGGGGTQMERALGSGVIVRSDGHVLTNQHVVDGAEEISVDLNTQRTYSAKVVGSDPASDLAVLKIGEGNLPVLELANSDQVRVGDVVLAVGNPLGVGETVTEGIISAKGRSTGLGNGNFEDFLQTDAAINQGNSGGALVNTRGELVGINSEILSTTGGNIGIGFAIPSNMARNVLGQLIQHGKVTRGMLGVSIQDVTSNIAQSLGLNAARGVLVNGVTAGGPADRAGIKTGDVILQLNGKDVKDGNSFRNEIAAAAPGTDVKLTIQRAGKQEQVTARLGELTPESARTRQQPSGQAAPSNAELGVTVEPLTPEIATQFGLPRGTQGVVIASVDPNGSAGEAGLEAGDLIQEVNRQPVRSPEDLQRALASSGERPPLLLINRGGQTIFVTVPRH